MSDTIKTALAWLITLVLVGSITTFVVWSNGNREAPEDCYENLSSYATWTEVRPLLIEYMEDNVFTIRECENTQAAYETARSNELRKARLEAYRAAIR